MCLPIMQAISIGKSKSESLGQEDPPGGGHGNPLQYSCLENPMDRGAWQASLLGGKELDMTEVT